MCLDRCSIKHSSQIYRSNQEIKFSCKGLKWNFFKFYFVSSVYFLPYTKNQHPFKIKFCLPSLKVYAWLQLLTLVDSAEIWANSACWEVDNNTGTPKPHQSPTHYQNHALPLHRLFSSGGSFKAMALAISNKGELACIRQVDLADVKIKYPFFIAHDL